jgi:solute carrier family 25 uncoupling protein 8/9
MMVEHALVPNVCISGVSVACATATTNPIDVVKVRMQALNTTNAKNANNNMLQTFRLVFRERGVGGFYVGLTPSLVRATTYGGLRLGLYDPIRRNLASNSEFFGGGDENRVTTKLLAGGCSGALAAFTLNPTELVKTRRMKGDSWQTIRTQVARDGVSSLWRGSSMAASRAALLTASQVAAYGEVKRLWIQMVPNAKDDWMAHVGASAAAGLITTATTNPVDVVKTRMFISGEGKKLSAKEAAMEVVREYGALRGAMRGFTANYIRLGPQTMVTFVVAEELRKWFGLESLK